VTTLQNWQVPVGNGNDKSKQLVDQNEINDDTTVYISQSSGNSNNNKGGPEWKVQSKDNFKTVLLSKLTSSIGGLIQPGIIRKLLIQ
jgi:hypothetical protein